MAAYPAEAIAGVTTASARQRGQPVLAAARAAAQFSLPLPAATTPAGARQAGGAGPWAFVRVKAAVPLTQPLMAGYKMTKQVSVVQGRARALSPAATWSR
jgi:hypothetical protein